MACAICCLQFGGRVLCEEYDAVLLTIWREYEACVNELEEIEAGLDIDSPHRHFRQRSRQLASRHVQAETTQHVDNTDN